jgi:methionyl-tRNA formyltransferase
MSKKRILIATIKSWNINNAEEFKHNNKEKYDVFIVSQKEDLNKEFVDKIKPDYIFFPHWSWIIPPEIYENFECIVFHMTDLPYGRGGSPLQNLIVNKVYNTKISAIQVEAGLDTGKIFLKEPFYVGVGSAQEIFQKISNLVFFKMIPEILEKKLIPFAQAGEPLNFKRRLPEQSNLLNNAFEDEVDLYDFIRMLDAEGYPRAFVDVGKFKLEFYNVQNKSGKLVGTFEVTKVDGSK